MDIVIANHVLTKEVQSASLAAHLFPVNEKVLFAELKIETSTKEVNLWFKTMSWLTRQEEEIKIMLCLLFKLKPDEISLVTINVNSHEIASFEYHTKWHLNFNYREDILTSHLMPSQPNPMVEFNKTLFYRKLKVD